MKRIAGIASIVAALLAVAAELVAPRLVADRVEQGVRERSSEATAVRADAGAFPFLPTLLAQGQVRRLSVTLEQVAGQQVPIAEVTFGLEGIQLDRDALFAGEVEVTDIDTGTVTLELELGPLGDALGDALSGLGGIGELGPDAFTVRERTLVIAPAGVAGAEVPLPGELLPCAPDQVAVGDGVVRLSCAFTEVPGILVQSAG